MHSYSFIKKKIANLQTFYKTTSKKNQLDYPKKKMDSSAYSFKQTKFWCHNCTFQFSRLVNTSEKSEVFCSRCNNVCEEILSSNGSETRNFIPFSNAGRIQNEDQYENTNESNRNSNTGFPGFQRIFITHTFLFPEFHHGNGSSGPFIPFGSVFPNDHNDGLFFIFNNFFNVGERQQENPNPPADKNVVLNLKEIVVDEKNEKEMNEKECSICQENFKAKEIGKELKCNHLYHKDCIERWLKMHSTCPCCRGAVV